MNVEGTDINRVMELVEEAARKAEKDAGLNGHVHDGGARHMRSELSFFRYGLNREVPPVWDKYVKQVRRERDPEYERYLILKKRFEAG